MGANFSFSTASRFKYRLCIVSFYFPSSNFAHLHPNVSKSVGLRIQEGIGDLVVVIDRDASETEQLIYSTQREARRHIELLTKDPSFVSLSAILFVSDGSSVN